MRTIKFPKMFNANSTNVWKADEHLEATKQSTLLVLQTEKNEMFGDPYFGMLFKKFLFGQKSKILKDQLVDIIYEQLALFIPQIRVKREDIIFLPDIEKGKLYCRFHGINQIDYKLNTYNLLIYADDTRA